MEWQPIETAPMDGTSVLLTAGKAVWQGHYIANRPPGEPPYRWNEYGPRWTRSGLAEIGFFPTHWMPLPEPPPAQNLAQGTRTDDD